MSPSRKFWGFTMSRNGIDLDTTKDKAIKTMDLPITCKQLKIFMGRVSYIRKFISALLSSWSRSTNCSRRIYHSNGGRSNKKLSRKAKMCSIHLWLWSRQGLAIQSLFASTKILWCFLRRSRVSSILCTIWADLRRAEMNYSSIEHLYFVVIFSMQKLRHYLLAHCLNLVTKSNPLNYILS